jgi:Rod binding domain-containing protein
MAWMQSAPMGMGSVQKNPEEISRQFEAILVRQLLSESMKPLLEAGGGGQMYGYFISEALADGITKGGGLGIRSILEAQLRLGELDAAPPRDP